MSDRRPPWTTDDRNAGVYIVTREAWWRPALSVIRCRSMADALVEQADQEARGRKVAILHRRPAKGDLGPLKSNPWPTFWWAVGGFALFMLLAWWLA